MLNLCRILIAWLYREGRSSYRLRPGRHERMLHHAVPTGLARQMEPAMPPDPPLTLRPRVYYSADDAMRSIRAMDQVKRRRLGLLLARAKDDVLLGWRVVKGSTMAPVSCEGLSGMQWRLYNYIGQGSCRECDALAHLWPAEIVDARSNDTVYARLQTRLRKLQSKTNQNLAMFRPGSQIRRRHGPQGCMLFVSDV